MAPCHFYWHAMQLILIVMVYIYLAGDLLGGFRFVN